MKKFAIVLVALLTAVILVIGAIAGWGWRQSRLTPTWWDAPRTVAATPEEATTLAQSVENRLVSEFNAVREGETAEWSVSLTEAEANAWLAERLPKWLANQEIESEMLELVEEVRLFLEDGRIRIGAALRDGPESEQVRIYSALVSTDQGTETAPFRIEDMGVGRLSMPIGAADQGLEMGFHEEFGEGGLNVNIRDAEQEIDLVLEVTGDRIVRIIGIETTGEAVVLHCRTSKKP